MNLFAIILLLTAHFVLAFLLLRNPKSRLRSRKEYWIPVFLVPLFGPLSALAVEILSRSGDAGARSLELEPLKAGNDLVWNSFVRPEGDQEVIPLEEAILLNNRKTRRKAVLNTFRDDPMSYLEVLFVARNNEDVDTTHYATIQISKIQRQFQLKLQSYAADYKLDPDNPALLDEYIDCLETYLQSPLPEKSVLRHQQDVLAELLDRKLSRAPNDRETLIRKLRIVTGIRGDYAAAAQVMDQLEQAWPEEEDTWIEVLRACVEWSDHERILAAIAAMQSPKIRWTKPGKALVRPWVVL